MKFQTKIAVNGDNSVWTVIEIDMTPLKKLGSRWKKFFDDVQLVENTCRVRLTAPMPIIPYQSK